MAERKANSAEQKASPLFRVRPTKQARRESRPGARLFESASEALWVVSQLKLLRHWPLDKGQQARVGSDLDFSKVQYQNEAFYELRLDDAHLRRKNLRVFFWVHVESRTIWIIHAYWKKTRRLDTAVKTLVARRIKNLKGSLQDRSIT